MIYLFIYPNFIFFIAKHHGPKYYICNMKIFKIIILLLFFSFKGFAQTNYYKCSLPAISAAFENELEKYVRHYGNDVKTNRFLDSCAFERANYYLSVLETTAEFHNSGLKKVFKKIPEGRNELLAHNRFFGDTSYFKESNVSYVETFREFQQKNLEIVSEIMQQSYWSGIYDTRMSTEKIIKRAVFFLGSDFNSYPKHILDSYIHSPSHHKCILKYGKGICGISTIAIVSEKKFGVGGWKYEVVVKNVVVFSEKLP